MKTLLSILSAAAFLLIATGSLSAQDEPTPKKLDNPQWKRVIYVDYHAGKMGRAREIIQNYHMKASEMSGTPAPELVLYLNTGDYDLMAIWALSEGIESLNWEVSPNSIKWRKAMNELAGGKEKADAIIAEYQSCIRNSKVELARVE